MSRDTTAFCADDYVPSAIDWPEGLPQPGIYHDVPFDVYRAWPAVSQSSLKYGRHTSLYHMRQLLDGKLKSKDSEAKRFGRAIHCGVLEPAKFAATFEVPTTCGAVISTGDRKGQACGSEARYKDSSGLWFCGTHRKSFDAQLVTELATRAEVEAIRCLRASLAKNCVCRLLKARGGSEVSFTAWVDGVPVKGRVDRLVEGPNPVAIDLKKIQSGEGHEESIRRQIRRYDYDLQAALYTTALGILLNAEVPWVWIFAEDAEPFQIVPKQAGPNMLGLGAIKFRQVLGPYKFAMESGLWPSYSANVGDVDASDTIDMIEPDHWECFQQGMICDRGG